jgi:hypothetical protein
MLFEKRTRIDNLFVIPGHRKAMGPESILPAVVIDSGLAREFIIGPRVRADPLVRAPE